MLLSAWFDFVKVWMQTLASLDPGTRASRKKECRVKLINVTRATIPNNEQSRNRRVRMKLALFYRVFSVGRRWMSSTMRNGDAFLLSALNRPRARTPARKEQIRDAKAIFDEAALRLIKHRRIRKCHSRGYRRIAFVSQRIERPEKEKCKRLTIRCEECCLYRKPSSRRNPRIPRRMQSLQ